MAHLYKEKRTCNCGFGTLNRGAWSTHKKSCRHDVIKNDKDETISILKQQLAAKDRQIEELIRANKKPRTVTNNNRYVVEQHINVFGKESLSHISHEQIQRLLADPENAVAKFVKLKHREPRNANVRCPNVNRSIYQVVVGGEGGEKEWENRAKGDVLERLYDDNSAILEGEAIEEEHTPFLNHQDRVKASASADTVDGGKCYKEQLDRIHNIITS